MPKLVADKTLICPHTNRPYNAKGLCKSCYSSAMRKKNTRMAECHPDRPHYSKGMCYPCWRKDYRVNKNPLENSDVAKLLGFTKEDYAREFILQGGLCALCRKPPKPGKRFDIDHDSDTMKFRGLLCNNCNRGIGHLKHNLETLRRAILYLERNLELPPVLKGHSMSYDSRFKGAN